MFYELAVLTTIVGQTTLAVPQVAAYSRAPEARGWLVGCWRSEFGPQNRIVVLREFAVRDDLEGERQCTLHSADPFGCGQYLTALSLESHAPFLDLPPIEVGAFGPLYEFRSYTLKPGAPLEALEAWSDMLSRRTRPSRLVIAMHALDGGPRFTHLWAYRGWDERMSIRPRALRGRLQPRSVPHTLGPAMVSEVYLPTENSPLQ
jgi:hypothetical protein